MNTENDIKMKELAEHFQQEQPHLMRLPATVLVIQTMRKMRCKMPSLKSAQNSLMRRALK